MLRPAELALGLLLATAVSAAAQDDVREAVGWTAERFESAEVAAVLHLDGFRAGEPWYDAAYAAARRRRIEWIDATVAQSGPEREEIIDLLRILRTAPRPLLVHARVSRAKVRFVAVLADLVAGRVGAEQAADRLARWDVNPLVPAPDAYAHFVRDWQGQDHFFRTYRVDARPPADAAIRRIGFRPTAFAETTASYGVRDRPTTPPRPTAKADLLGGWTTDRSRPFLVADDQPPQPATLFTDYDALMSEDPGAAGPTLLGHTFARSPDTTRRTAKPPGTASPASGPRLGLPVTGAAAAEPPPPEHLDRWKTIRGRRRSPPAAASSPPPTSPPAPQAGRRHWAAWQ